MAELSHRPVESASQAEMRLPVILTVIDHGRPVVRGGFLKRLDRVRTILEFRISTALQVGPALRRDFGVRKERLMEMVHRGGRGTC